MIEQKQQHLSISLELCDRAASDSSFLGNAITGDETWIYGYDPETRVQSSQWKSPISPRARQARQSRSDIKVMMIVFFDLDGIVRTEFVSRNTTGLLERLRNDVRRKRPEKWASGFILHHDNAPCHTSLLVRQFLLNKNITVCPHPPYSPDLAPCDFCLFPIVKMTMKGKRFESIQDIEAATTAPTEDTHERVLPELLQKVARTWYKCVRSEEEYFEGD